jgi:hypothetical protein
MAKIPANKRVTEQEVYDNYEFKVIKRALMREYPWVTDIKVSQEDLDEYMLIFLELDIDLPKLVDQTGWTLSAWVKRAFNDGDHYRGNNIAIFFDTPGYAVTRPLQDEMNRLIESIHNSPALPEDLKLMTGRSFSVGEFHVNRGGRDWFAPKYSSNS